MKKLFAILLAVAMVMGLALTASADNSLDCTGWWTAHTEGVEVTEDGIEITFTNTTYADAASNWNGPLWVLYTGDEAKVNGAGYAEYWVERGDIYGWAGGALGAGNSADAAALATLGVTHEAVAPADWAAWLTSLKAGIECKLVAKRDGGNIVATLTVGEAVSTVTVPFPADKTAYISLTGELTTLSNITVKTPDPVNPDSSLPSTGDAISVVVALAAVSAFGAAIVLKKKEF